MIGRTPPIAVVSKKYRNDLSEGACFDDPGFLDQPLAVQYVACLGCPVRDLCPVPTPWPRGECCKRGHVAERYANGTCKVCRRVAGDDAQKRAEEAAVPAGVEDLRVQFVVTMRRGGFGWEEIVRDLRTKSTALHALLVAAGMLSLAEDLAEYQESRRCKPGTRPPGRPRTGGGRKADSEPVNTWDGRPVYRLGDAKTLAEKP